MKIPFLDKIPKIYPDAFVAEDANVIGDVN